MGVSAEALLDLASAGFRVFPVRVEPDPAKPGKHLKTPLCAWKDAATREFYALDWSAANGIGIALDPGTVVVDIDTPAAVETIKRDWPELAALKDAPLVRTISGGYHLYLSCDAAAALTQADLAPQVNTRVGGSGFVVGPGTEGYRLVRGSFDTIPQAPTRLVQRLARPEAAKPRPAAEESLRGLALATRYLLDNPPTDAPSDGVRFALACRLRGFGLEQETARQLMHRWNSESEHERDPSQIDKAVENAWKHAHDAEPGGDLPPTTQEMFGDGFEPAEELPADHPDVILGQLQAALVPAGRPEHMGDLWEDLPPIDALVPGLLARGDLYVDAAQPGSAKTYRSLDFALSAAYGRKWCGQLDMSLPEADRRVAFLAFEDYRGVRERFRAWAQHEGIPRSDQRIRIYGKSLQPFSNREATAQLLAELADYKPGIVVISTFGDAMAGADAMKETDLRAIFVRTIRTLQELVPGVVIYVEAHEGKGNKDVLAHQALRACADLMTLSSLDPKTGVTTVEITKSPKHFARPANPIILTAEPTTVKLRIDGADTTNLVYRKPALRVTMEAQAATEDRERWEALIEAHHERGISGPSERAPSKILANAADRLGVARTTVARWFATRDKFQAAVLDRYRHQLCQEIEGAKSTSWRYYVNPESELSHNLAYILDGSG